jgi:hypothetical protein
MATTVAMMFVHVNCGGLVSDVANALIPPPRRGQHNTSRIRLDQISVVQ